MHNKAVFRIFYNTDIVGNKQGQKYKYGYLKTI